MPMSPSPLVWDVPEPFIQSLTVDADHLDEFGHVNNVVYLQWAESVAWAHSAALGLGMADYQRLGAGCVVRRHELDYLAATRSEERRVGKECRRLCRSRWSPYH
jgi:acyl-CoA thioester hydrolase